MKSLLTLLTVLVFTCDALAQTTFYTQNFSTSGLPAGWTNVDNTGNNPTNGIWKRRTNFAGFASSTASGGFYVFISDAQSDDGLPEDADLTSSAINCSAHSHVAIEFQQYFYTYYIFNNNSKGKLLVSNDGTNWQQVYVVSNTTVNPETVRIDISNIAANQPTVYLRFNYTGDWDGWWAIDDIKLFNPPANDVSVTSLNMPKYVSLSDQVVTGTLYNKGNNNITSVELTYTVDGNNPVTLNLTSLNLQPFKTYTFQFADKVAMKTAKSYNISVTASNPNGVSDADNSDNTLSTTVSALSAIPQKNVLLEEFTTAVCQFCPDGAYVVDTIIAAHNYVIPVGIHAGFGTDGMTTNEATDLANAFASGAPSACVDRIYYRGESDVAISRDIWSEKCVERYAQVTPVRLSVNSTYDDGTRQLNVTVGAKFFTEATGNFRINCYIIEDSVSGTGSQYNQQNYYNTQAGHPYYGKGNPIIGYKHRYVQREALGNTWGTTGVIPATTASDVEYTHNYTYTLPNNWNADRCYLVAFIHEYNSNPKSGKNEVYNALRAPLNGSVTHSTTPSYYISSPTVSNLRYVNVYPNPVQDVAIIEYYTDEPSSLTFELSNLYGQIVFSANAEEGANSTGMLQVPVHDLSNGTYLLTVRNGGVAVRNFKLVVNR
ncbi:MAG: Omp28-related outer membrane protein [Chitinophagales bacterium]|nr:Omp28-related outer membrane protein [Chitinophagales bacterium]MDW8418057.1 Omp28-related outer membrane protein [Chitinophagales bacterium]